MLQLTPLRRLGRPRARVFLGLLYGFCLLLASSTAFAANCGGGGNRTYHFDGKLTVRHNGNEYDLEGVQLRIVRQGSPLKWAQGPDAVTGPDGRFSVDCQFARDKNGAALPGGGKIPFKVMARFRNDELKIRKGGWTKNNWFEVARVKGCRRSKKALAPACKDFRFDADDGLEKAFDTEDLSGKHAYLWWFYQHLDQSLEQDGVGLTKRPWFSSQLTVVYPDRSVLTFWDRLKERLANGDEPTAFYVFNIHLAAELFDKRASNRTRILVHEWMHRWDVGHAENEAHISCLVGEHHKAPGSKGNTRCNGFMEGFAEATAQRLTKKIDAFPSFYAGPKDREAMQNDGYTSLRRAQRTDRGWENFLKLFWTHNEWAQTGGKRAWGRVCDPKDVSVVEMLQAIQADSPKKGRWYKLKGDATFEWFNQVLVRQVPGFDAEDARIYRLLGNPDLSRQEVFHRVGNTLVIDGAKADGKTDYVLKTAGNLAQARGKVSGRAVTIQSGDSVSGTKAEGTVANGADGFRSCGRITHLELTDPTKATLYLDGDEAHTVVVKGLQGKKPTDYQVEGGNSVRMIEGRLQGYRVTRQANDEVKGATAEGRVAAGADGYIVTGEDSEIQVTLDNPDAAKVFVDGRRQNIAVDPGVVPQKQVPRGRIQKLPGMSG